MSVLKMFSHGRLAQNEWHKVGQPVLTGDFGMKGVDLKGVISKERKQRRHGMLICLIWINGKKLTPASAGVRPSQGNLAFDLGGNQRQSDGQSFLE